MAVPEAVQMLARNFKENGFKYLLRNPDNVRDFLMLGQASLVPHVDFSQMQVLPTTFITPDFRHLESDLFLRAPLLVDEGEEPVDVQLYVLIEHQSEPDDFAGWRAMHYQNSGFAWQQRQWLQTHDDLRDFLFDPILPIVLYSGTRSWTRLKSISELVKQSQRIKEHLPKLKPVFFNLAKTKPRRLHSQGGLLGWVLHLFQQRQRKEALFRTLLLQTLSQIDSTTVQAGRRDELLWYLHALLYHERQDEADRLAESVRRAVRPTLQREVTTMGKSYAEILQDRGAIKGKQDTLVRQLRKKWTLSAGLEAIIRATDDVAQLDTWAEEAIMARKLSDISFPPGA